MITISDSAVKQLCDLQAGKSCTQNEGLRIFVEAGGCSGLQYGMRFDKASPDDTIVETEGARVLVDAFSSKYLDHAMLDFVDGLTGAGFKIVNPDAARTCGCGTSFEYAQAEKAHSH